MTHVNLQAQSETRLAFNEVEMAAALGVSVSWLQHDRCSRRFVPFYRLGGNIRYNPARVSGALAALEEGGEPAPAALRRKKGAAA